MQGFTLLASIQCPSSSCLLPTPIKPWCHVVWDNPQPSDISEYVGSGCTYLVLLHSIIYCGYRGVSFEFSVLLTAETAFIASCLDIAPLIDFYHYSKWRGLLIISAGSHSSTATSAKPRQGAGSQHSPQGWCWGWGLQAGLGCREQPHPCWAPPGSACLLHGVGGQDFHRVCVPLLYTALNGALQNR